MAEEQQQTTEQQAPETAPEQQAPVVNEVEARAREQGWVPKEEWTGDPAQWRDATSFVDRGELLGKIKSQSAEMRELRSMVEYLADKNKKLYDAGYTRAIEDLEARRDAALEEKDMQAVRALDKEIKAHEKARDEELRAAPATTTSAARSAEIFNEWQQRNQWYTKDEVMQNWANGAAIKLRAQQPRATEEQLYEFLEKEVRKVFPDKFKRVGAPSPDGATNRGAGSPARKDGNSEFDALLSELSEEEANIARNLVKRGHVTKEKFISDFKLVSGRR